MSTRHPRTIVRNPTRSLGFRATNFPGRFGRYIPDEIGDALTAALCRTANHHPLFVREAHVQARGAVGLRRVGRSVHAKRSSTGETYSQALTSRVLTCSAERVTRSILIGWLLSLPYVNAVPRPPEFAVALSNVVLSMFTASSELPILARPVEVDAARRWSALIDTFAALEGAYRADAAGDCKGLPAGSPKCKRLDASGKPWAASCGMLQTPCAITPTDAEGQIRLALSIFLTSARMCPAMPLSPYAKGACVPWRGAAFRERLIDRALRSPMVGDASADRDGIPEVSE